LQHESEDGESPGSSQRPAGGGLLAAALRRANVSEASKLILLAIIVGVGSGLGAVAFRWLIEAGQFVFFHRLAAFFAFLGPYRVVPVPAAGGLVVGLLTYTVARQVVGGGVPEVILAVASFGGRIRGLVGLMRSVASAVCIASGGSAGREGPIIQIGSSFGSALAQMLRLPESRIRLLVACGAAGGVAATFNVPIAGALFALEVILQEYAASSFGFVVFSSVTAAAVSRWIQGNQISFQVPAYELVSLVEFPLYVALGVLAGGVAFVFVTARYGAGDVFDRWHVREYIKPVAGGLVIGLLGVFYPQVFGIGYGVQPLGGPSPLDSALLGRFALGLTAMLVLMKIVATSVTLGSGGSGGVFAPSLFIGAMLGATFGSIAHGLWPGLTAGAGAYALVGMGAVFAGAARAPITSIIILFEMTADHRIILPLMIAVVTSSLLMQLLTRDTIYTLKIRRRGIEPQRHPAIDLLDTVTVGEVMVRESPVVPADMPVRNLARVLLETGHRGAPVVDANGKLVGIVTLSDIQRSAVGEEARVAGDVADETVREAQLKGRDVGQLPVVDRLDPTRVMGVLERTDVIAAYARLLHERANIAQECDRLRISVPGFATVEAPISPGSPADGRQVQDLNLPPNSLLVTVRRGASVIVPRGETQLVAGDVVTALVDPAQQADLEMLLSGSGK
jgi:CIC family chloride channel protein